MEIIVSNILNSTEFKELHHFVHYIITSDFYFVIGQETRVRLNPRNNSSGSDYINADFVKVKIYNNTNIHAMDT